MTKLIAAYKATKSHIKFQTIPSKYYNRRPGRDCKGSRIQGCRYRIIEQSAYTDMTAMFPAQICQEQTDIYPKGGRQDNLA